MEGTAAAKKPAHPGAVTMVTMLLDAEACRAIALLASHDVPAILLKGRVTAHWLYGDGPRHYGDIDLLVDPARRMWAMEVLRTIGYRHALEGAAPCEYGPNETDLIGPMGVKIDLHHTLLGITASPERSWEVLQGHTEELRIEGMTVEGRPLTVLGPVARTMHLALHVAQNGPIDTKAVADLERGLRQLPASLWQDAAVLADELSAAEAFSAGLRVTDNGRDLATRLGLSAPRDVSLVLRAQSAPQVALQIQNLVSATSMSGRLRLIGRKLWPTPVYMQRRVAGTRNGRWSLLAARIRRLAGLPRTFFVALRAWNQARHAAEQLPVEPKYPSVEKEVS